MSQQLVLICCAVLLLADPLVVNTSSGFVRGFANGTHHVYRGIPYARAPIGDLRWRPPVEAVPWKGVRDATHFNATCSQPPGGVTPPGQPPPGYWNSLNITVTSEDCLFVNVYTPAHMKSNSTFPVMVYIHAGEFWVGSSNDLENDWAPAPDVILVTFNFRVGAFGFMGGEMLRNRSSDGSTGNYGMQDQRYNLYASYRILCC